MVLMRFLIKTKTIISASVLALSLLVNSIFPVQAGENCTYFAHPSDLVTDDLDDFIADPVEGSYWSWDFYKNEACRYYYNDIVPCENSEPPGIDPAIYDFPSSDIPGDRGLPNYFDPHYPQPPCVHETSGFPPSPPLEENPLFVKYRQDESITSSFRYQKLGLGHYIEALMTDTDASISARLIRNDDIDNPGNYLMFPLPYSEIPVELEDKIFVDKLLRKYLATVYYSESIVDSIDNIFLDDLNRREFFFESILNGTRFRFAGWYNEFAHIFVYSDFDSKDGFVEAAHRFFKLPSLDKKNISYDEDDLVIQNPDFFYSYDDQEIDFKLVAYPNLKADIVSDTARYYYDGVILDLTVYPEEE